MLQNLIKFKQLALESA